MKISDIFAMAGGKKPTTESASPSGPTAPPTLTPPTGDSREEIVAFIKKFFEPRRVNEGLLELPPEVGVPPLLISTIAKELHPLIDDVQLATARGLASEWDIAVRSMNEFGRDKVGPANAAQQTALAEAQISGKPLEDGWTKADIESDFAARRAALKRAARERSLEAAILFASVSGRVSAHLRKHGEEVAIEEFKRFAKYGVDYQVSLLVRTLLFAGAFLDRQSERLVTQQAGLGRNPKEIFALIGIDL